MRDIKASCTVQLTNLLIATVKDVERETARLDGAFRRADVDALDGDLTHDVTGKTRCQ